MPTATVLFPIDSSPASIIESTWRATQWERMTHSHTQRNSMGSCLVYQEQPIRTDYTS